MILYLLLLSLLQEPVYIPKSRVLEIHKEYVVFETIDRKKYRLNKQSGKFILIAVGIDFYWYADYGKRLQVLEDECMGCKWVDVP